MSENAKPRRVRVRSDVEVPDILRSLVGQGRVFRCVQGGAAGYRIEFPEGTAWVREDEPVAAVEWMHRALCR